jgi:hypothetical protein
VLPGLIVGALALWHFIDIKPENLSWMRWIEHGINRYQTLLTGLGAVLVGYLSVIKISQQIRLQKDERVSNQKFALRHELRALGDCRSVVSNLNEMTENYVAMMGEILPDGKPFIPFDPAKVLSHYRDFLPRSVVEGMENLDRMIISHNDFNQRQPGFMSQHSLFIAVKANSAGLLRRIDEARQELEAYIPPSAS